ncbi:MAG: adaptor protein MecA [Lachnospiraceae bacterium]|nr:adaptor protein MecA [Lachnospiraceae bacterium]
MRIEKIDDKTMKCFLSKEELEEYDISYKDFILRSDKAREVMEDIMNQAEEEVGFKPPQFALELQIMVLPDQGMILIFSEKTPEDLKNAKGVMECLGMIKDTLGLKDEDISKALGMAAAGKEGKQPDVDPSKPGKSKELKEVAESVVTFAVFAFHSISDICNYARMLPGNLRVKSELYQMDGVYYLFLDKGSASYERYSRACIRALEFGSLYTAEESLIEHIREHGECLIADHAVKKMRL